MRCDYCSDPNPTWRYPARSFQTSGGMSITDWAACDACHALIEDTNLRGLACRTLRLMIHAHPELRDFGEELYEEIATLQQQFFQNRTGAAEPQEQHQ
jgi:hypothetical protein